MAMTSLIDKSFAVQTLATRVLGNLAIGQCRG